MVNCPDSISIRKPVSEKDFQEYYHLRWKILRKPFKKPPGSERDDSDGIATHFMAVNRTGNVVGGGRVHLNTDQEAQIRYMFVDDHVQGSGVGRLLVQQLEQEAVRMGAVEMILYARDYAIDFYRKCGYTIIKKSYLLFDVLQHYKMGKTLK